MVRITKQSKIDLYFNNKEYVGQSSLKLLLRGFKYYLDNVDKDISDLPWIKIGSAVDLLLTGEEEEFDKQFYVIDSEKLPSESIMKVVDAVWELLITFGSKLPLEEADEYIALAVENNEYQRNWKLETRINKIKTLGKDYFESLVGADGRKVLSIEERVLINQIVQNLLTDKRTSKYLDKENNNGYTQFPIYFTYKDLKVKVLLDLLLIEETDTKFILKPFDIKTMYDDTLNFPEAIKKRRYDIQAASYTEAVWQWGKKNVPEGKELVVEPFRFIVESTGDTGTPLVYEMNTADIVRGLLGVPDEGVRGYNSLVEEYKYYQEHNWEKDRVLIENPEIIKIDNLWNLKSK